ISTCKRSLGPRVTSRNEDAMSSRSACNCTQRTYYAAPSCLRLSRRVVRLGTLTLRLFSCLCFVALPVERGSPRLSAASEKLSASTTRVNICMAWKRSIAFSDCSCRTNSVSKKTLFNCPGKESIIHPCVYRDHTVRDLSAPQQIPSRHAGPEPRLYDTRFPRRAFHVFTRKPLRRCRLGDRNFRRWRRRLPLPHGRC